MENAGLPTASSSTAATGGRRYCKLGVRQNDRVAYIAPNTRAQLESFYAVPQIGAVLVPLNYRLTPKDFTYLINHSGSSVVCAHSDYFDAVDSIRAELPHVQHFVALEGVREGWLTYESLIAAANSEFVPAEISENDLLTINYTSGTTSKPKGVMITHRNAYMNVSQTNTAWRRTEAGGPPGRSSVTTESPGNTTIVTVCR
jgi:fatty-acyl-CoA synthase